MGTWGTGLYQDDLALDIKEDYQEKLKKYGSNEEALRKMLEEYADSIEDSDEGPIFWMALADTMWELGRLTIQVKEKALKELKNNEKKWKEEASEKDCKKRKEELEKLKEKLNNIMPKEKKIVIKGKESRLVCEWKIGDIYAYQLKSEHAKKTGYAGKYLILRKVEKGTADTKKGSHIIYTQITKDEQLPKEKEELERLDYVIVHNKGNVKYQYKLDLYYVTQKILKEDLIYLGNYVEYKTPINEYEAIIPSVSLCFFTNIEEEVIRYIQCFNTSSTPKYIDIDPKNIMDTRIRFQMRERYYEESLNIIPPEGGMIKDNALMYIALIDAMTIGGFVQNPLGELTEAKKQEAYKRIRELEEIIRKRKDTEKEKRLKILEELRKKIENYSSGNSFLES